MGNDGEQIVLGIVIPAFTTYNIIENGILQGANKVSGFVIPTFTTNNIRENGDKGLIIIPTFILLVTQQIFTLTQRLNYPYLVNQI